MKEDKNIKNLHIDFEKLRKLMIEDQIKARGIKDQNVISAMLKVPREKFISPNLHDSAYDDRPLPIGFGQTISQPYIVALMTELLELNNTHKVLEIGTGCGYQTAILAEIANMVYSIEIIKELYEKAKLNLASYNNIILKNGDGYNGWREFSPYDRIIVTAAPQKIPQPLIDQLSNNGIIVAPEGPAGWSQVLIKIKKQNSKIATQQICDVAFVPLTRNYKETL